MEIKSRIGRSLRMRPKALRPVAGLGVFLLTLIVALPMPHGADAVIPGEFCLAPEEIKAMGSQTQTSLHINHFIPAYQNSCPAAVNKISYDPLGDVAAREALIKHNRGDGGPPYLLFASDLALTAVEKQSAENDIYHPFNPRLSSMVNHFPIATYGVAVAYNVGSCASTTPLRFTSRTLSLIYSGLITRWNDPLLVTGDVTNPDDDNPQLASCSVSMKVAVREDDAPATWVLKDYLSRHNPAFNVYKAREFSSVWPSTLTRGCRGVGDGGMSTCLTTPGTIGYVMYQEAYTKTNYQMAQLQNMGGQFAAPASNVTPTVDRTKWPDNCSAAADSAAVAGTNGDWSQVSLTGTTAGYGMCFFGYLLAFQRPNHALGGISSQELRTMVDYLNTINSDATQEGMKAYQVAPVPQRVRNLVKTGINNIS